MDRKVFEDGLSKIEMSFDNFKINKEKADLWYGLIKKIDTDIWEEKINNCIIYCRRNPTLADILDHNEYYTDPYDKNIRDRAIACKKKNPGCYGWDTNPDSELCQCCRNL